MAQDSTVMPRDRDEESGRYTETYPPEVFVDAVGEHGPTGTTGIADALGCSYELAYRRLRELEDEGRITSDRVGNARLWKPTPHEGEQGPEGD